MAEDKKLDTCLNADIIIETIKAQYNIKKPNGEMTDEEIAIICKEIGKRAPDTMWFDEEPILGRIGIGTMLFLTITEFPEFYERYGLSQFN